MTTFLVVLALLVLATGRIARFVAIDKLSEPARLWMVRKLGAESLLVYGLHCAMCLSIWIAVPAAAAAWWAAPGAEVLPVPAWIGVPVLWLAIAYAAGLVVAKESR